MSKAKSNKITGVAIATAAAGLFSMLSAGVAQAGDEGTATVHCEHSSSCKGHGSCQTANNACAGLNACKGQGPTEQASEAACKDAQRQARKS